MAPAQQNSRPPEELERCRLLDEATRHGKPDHYQGKRRWPRYTIETRLEVTTDRASRAEAWTCTMHNISVGGIGFWSKRSLPQHSTLYVREWREDNSGVWLAAHVRHCTLGMAGYLVGAAFDTPCPESATPPRQSNTDTAPRSGENGGSWDRAPWLSLRMKCAVVSAVASGIGTVQAALICGMFWPDNWLFWAPIIGVAYTLILGGLLGWASAGSESRSIKMFRVAAQRLAEGRPRQLSFLRPSTKELGELQSTYLQLAAQLRERVQAERIQKEKLQELNQIKSNILSIVSHDLRTPLTSIQLYAKMLEEELTVLSEQDQRRFLKIICDECTRLSNLVGDLLEVQRLEARRVHWDIRSQDVSQILLACAHSYKALAQSRSMTFTVECPRSLPNIEVDADRLHQVLSNLLSNAFKYGQLGGTVLLAAEGSGANVLIRVRDNGPGIPRDKWDQIFDRFTQLSDPNVSQIAGVGLGLYIVRQIVERHGGKVWVESEPGLGSEFFVSFPTAAPTVTQQRQPDAATSCGSVLVCDADPELAATIAQALRNEQFEVRVVHSACRLLAQLDQSEPDIVLTDVLLPDMNATDLLDALTDRPERGYRLIIHSYAGDGPVLRRRGVAVFLRRPAYKAELIKAAHVAMKKPAGVGRQALLLAAGSVDIERFNSLLSSEGYMPIVVEDFRAAAKLMEEYPIDVVLVPAELLNQQWTQLGDWADLSEDNVRLFVLCESVGRRERRLAEMRRAIPLTHRTGLERETVDALASHDRCPVPVEGS